MTDERVTILIVDDQPLTHDTFQIALEDESYDFLSAYNGQQMLTMVEAVQPDVVLLDVMMPGMDGLEACRRMKENPALRHIPVILVTALSRDRFLAEGLAAGADDFINKPFSRLELNARVRSMLRIKQRHDLQQEMITMRDQLSRMIIHDLRTPITTIDLYNNMLRRTVTDERERSYLEAIRQQTQQLSAFVSDMLLTMRMEQAQVALELAPVDVDELVMSVVRHYEPLVHMRHIELNTTLLGRTCCWELDRTLWKRMLSNLLDNALRYSPEAGRVELAVRCSADCLQVEIRDEGPQIPAEMRDTIFDRYQLASHPNRSSIRAGLGLSFCKEVMDAHGGTITVHDNRPQGSTFLVSIQG